MKHVIGIDFDNTIVNYDAVMLKTAQAWGLINGQVPRNKKEIRDHIRRLPDGDIQWQKLQAFIYGKAMDQAQLIDGVKEFVEFCKKEKWDVCVISHKTQFASMDREGIDLRHVALNWMRANGFFSAGGLGLSKKQIFFESTRAEKIARLKQLGCTHFIDDLEETFLEDSFPNNVEKILYASNDKRQPLKSVRVLSTWEEIYDYFAGARR
ncbi:MAG: hypothetical protein A2787_02150 [Omnitrophica WOR_2 bacterium RIFCSPHIGHO2_01_FULL_48_9]|nr:MAG: hypothetical protein A3D10_01870 [Omnitrophica WOR_2 bacterium RIFCSPHIGHO2_02_FULL_48_11]OGX34414.1 MAG: hypothetical protein A2787_02150 [Omnitrophica WOR_2 bacterium RIFCSPHIGHO2_01_FULL_48_9]